MGADRPAVVRRPKHPATHQQLGCYVENTEYNSVKLCHRFTRAIGSASPPLRGAYKMNRGPQVKRFIPAWLCGCDCGRGDALPGNANFGEVRQMRLSPDAKKIARRIMSYTTSTTVTPKVFGRLMVLINRKTTRSTPRRQSCRTCARPRCAG